MAYNPANFTPSAKALGVSSGSPTDGRTYKYDATNFVTRPFISMAEVLAELNTPASRKGHVSIIVNTGGTLASGVISGGTNDEYWFKDGIADGDLVLKSSSAVTSTPLSSTTWDLSEGAMRTLELANNTTLYLVSTLGQEGSLYIDGKGFIVTIDGFAPITTDATKVTLIIAAHTGLGISIEPKTLAMEGASGAAFTNAGRTAHYTNASMIRSGGAVTKWENADGDPTWDFKHTSTDPIDAGSDGLEITSFQNLLFDPTYIHMTGAFTMYLRLKNSADGGLLPDASGAGSAGIEFAGTSLNLRINDGGTFTATSVNGNKPYDNTKRTLVITRAAGTDAIKAYWDGIQVPAFSPATLAGTWTLGFLADSSGGAGNLKINGLSVFNGLEHDGATVATQSPLFAAAVL